jgi:hypothetical protein
MARTFANSAAGSNPVASANARNSITSRRRSRRSKSTTWDCGRPSTRATAACDSPLAFRSDLAKYEPDTLALRTITQCFPPTRSVENNIFGHFAQPAVSTSKLRPQVATQTEIEERRYENLCVASDAPRVNSSKRANQIRVRANASRISGTTIFRRECG